MRESSKEFPGEILIPVSWKNRSNNVKRLSSRAFCLCMDVKIHQVHVFNEKVLIRLKLVDVYAYVDWLT